MQKNTLPATAPGISLPCNASVLAAYATSNVKLEGRVTSVDYCAAAAGVITDGCGDLLAVTMHTDHSVRLYDVSTMRLMHSSKSMKLGGENVRFTHAKHALLVAATQTCNEADKSYAIRYLSMHDNRHLRLFKGHTERIASIDMNPEDDTFISTCEEQVRMWDLRTPQCTAKMAAHGGVLARFDPQGMIFGLACESSTIRLYDVRSYSNGPFATFEVDMVDAKQTASSYVWHTLRFSPSGEDMLLTATLGKRKYVIVLDAFEGHSKHTWRVPGEAMSGMSTLFEASFSPDGEFVAAAGDDGVIRVWQTKAEHNEHSTVCEWAIGTTPIRIVSFAPTRHLVIAAGDKQANILIPSHR